MILVKTSLLLKLVPFPILVKSFSSFLCLLGILALFSAFENFWTPMDVCADPGSAVKLSKLHINCSPTVRKRS